MKHSKLAKLLILVVKISGLLQNFVLLRPRPLVVYITGIHVARAESRIQFVTSALSQFIAKKCQCLASKHSLV